MIYIEQFVLLTYKLLLVIFKASIRTGCNVPEWAVSSKKSW